jgi:hypothetical protein
MMEQYLRGFCKYKQENSVELVPLAEIATNDVIYSSTKMTPFRANYQCHPVMQVQALNQLSSPNAEVQEDTFPAAKQQTQQTFRMHLEEARYKQTKYASGSEGVFEVGDRVWLSMRHFRRTRPSKRCV